MANMMSIHVIEKESGRAEKNDMVEPYISES